MAAIMILSVVYGVALGINMGPVLGLNVAETAGLCAVNATVIYNAWYWLATGRIPLLDFLFGEDR